MAETATQTPEAPSFISKAIEALNDNSAGTPLDPAKVLQDAAQTQPAKQDATKTEQADPEMPSEIKSEDGKKGWRTWKENYKKLEAERDSLRQERENAEKTLRGQIEQITKDLEIAKKGYMDPKEIEALKQEREDLRVRLRIKDVTADPSWKADIEEPLSRAIESAKQAVPRDRRGEMERLLALPPSEARTDAIDEIIGQLSPYKQIQAVEALKSIDAVNAKKASLLSDTKAIADRYEAFQKEQSERTVQGQRKQVEDAVESLLRIASDPKNGLGVFVPGETEESKQEAFKAAAMVRELATADLAPKDRANISAWAVYGQKAPALLKAAHDEIAKLRTQVEKLTAATPSGGASTPSGGASKPASFVEVALSQLLG